MRIREGIRTLYKPVLTRHREETFACVPSVIWTMNSHYCVKLTQKNPRRIFILEFFLVFFFFSKIKTGHKMS